jgi:hypothetical protein
LRRGEDSRRKYNDFLEHLYPRQTTPQTILEAATVETGGVKTGPFPSILGAEL